MASNFKTFDLKAKSREAPLGLKRIVTVFKAHTKGVIFKFQRMLA